MRRYAFLLPLLVACGILSFSVEQHATTTVEGAGVLGSLLGVLDLGGFDDFDVEIEQKMQDQGVADGDLRSVTLSTLALSSADDLSFITSMDVYVSGDGVDEVLVASVDDIPAGATDVALTTTGADLTDIVVAGGMAFRVDASGNAPEDDTDIDVHVVVDIEATPQGACNAAKKEAAD
jgi:hypothetical protein